MDISNDNLNYFINVELKDYIKNFKPMIADLFRKYTSSQKIKFSEDEINDLLQDCILLAYEKSKDPSFRLTSKGSTFLYGIANNKIREHLRKRGKEVPFEINEDIYNPQDDSEAAIERKKDESKKLKLIEECMELLTKTQKRVFKLFYFNDFSMKEIALNYNTTESSMKTQNFKAKKSIQDCVTSKIN